MNAPRFFCDLGLRPGLCLDLPETVARHAARVLRLPPGSAITLFDGRGGEYPATLEAVGKEKVTARLGDWRAVERESSLDLTLAQAIQAADKMDYTLQKAVELGVNAIVPVASARSVVKLSGERQCKRQAHWQAVVIAACEQCGRNRAPEVLPVHALPAWLHTCGRALSGVKWMLSPGAPPLGAQRPIDNPANIPVTLLVGAEGGLTAEETQDAESAGFLPVGLGPRILRTETAALAALAALQALWGDFKGGS
jgi:16S rRNA (uracil1498-N3)-methyltransferase